MNIEAAVNELIVATGAANETTTIMIEHPSFAI